MDEHGGTALTASSAPARPGPGTSARPTAAAVPSGDEAARPEGVTGDPAVDEALTRLATLDGTPLREHVAVFDAVHTALQDRLADTEG